MRERVIRAARPLTSRHNGGHGPPATPRSPTAAPGQLAGALRGQTCSISWQVTHRVSSHPCSTAAQRDDHKSSIEDTGIPARQCVRCFKEQAIHFTQCRGGRIWRARAIKATGIAPDLTQTKQSTSSGSIFPPEMRENKVAHVSSRSAGWASHSTRGPRAFSSSQ